MSQTKWFERKFDFSSSQNIFPSIIERLRGTPARLEEKIKGLSEALLNNKPDNTWSIKENVGHLIDLEELWVGRLEDILLKKEMLRPTDLANSKTDLANHNRKKITDLLNEFRSQRHATISKIEKLTEREIFLTALHPRLKTPMRTMDHFLFVAEHDDHHLVRIEQLIKMQK